MKIFIEPKYVAAAVQCMGKSDIRDWDAIKAWAAGLPKAFGLDE